MTDTRTQAGGRPVVPPAEPRSYYGEPVIAEPVWSWEIPLYFAVGGLAGASATLSLLSDLRGNDVLARRAAAAALAGSVISPALLISDLGKPSRFLYMLRVFKPTSPMSVGSWILSGFGAASTLSAARQLLGLFPRAGRLGQVGAALLGPPLASYTAALVAQTAVPVWHEARRTLPFLFVASSSAAAGGLAAALTPVHHAAPARRLAVGGGVASILAGNAMERSLGDLGEPYHQGASGALTRAAKAVSLGGAVAMAAFGGRRAGAAAAGAALVAGSLLERWAIFRAGFASARDPAATVSPQRERLRESGGRPSRYVRA